MDLEASPTCTPGMQPAPSFSSPTSLSPIPVTDIQALLSYVEFPGSDCRTWTTYLHSRSLASSLYIADLEEQQLLSQIESVFSVFLHLLYKGADLTEVLKALVGLLYFLVTASNSFFFFLSGLGHAQSQRNRTPC
jgi:hypothetical protein